MQSLPYTTKSKMYTTLMSTVALVISALILSPDALAAKGKTAGLGLANTHEAKKSNITPSNIKNLQHMWTYETTDAGEFNEFAGVEVMPLKKGGILYFPSADGNMHAIRAKDRSRVWRKSLAADYSDEAAGRTIFVSRNTPVIKGDVLYIATSAFILTVVPGVVCETSNDALGCIPGQTGSYLLAINRHTGALIDTVQLDDSLYSNVTASPVLHKGKIIVSLSSIEEVANDALDPDLGDTFLRCCRFRGKTVAVNLSGTALDGIAWKFYHVPSFDGDNNKSNLPANNQKRIDFEKDLAAFDRARRNYLAALDPAGDKYVAITEETLPQRESFSGAGVWTRGNPTVDKSQGIVMVSPGSNYSVPDLVKQCQRVRQGNINPTPGNTDYTQGELDPQAFLLAEHQPGDSSEPLNCDNINLRLDNYLLSVVAIDIKTGQPKWTMRPEVREQEALDAGKAGDPGLFKYDTWNTTCMPNDGVGRLYNASFLGPLASEPGVEVDFLQELECDSLVKPDDYGFAQTPMILRNVHIHHKGYLDIAAIGNKSGNMFMFDIATGGKHFYRRIKTSHGGIYAGHSFPYATDNKVIFMAANASQSIYKDLRAIYNSARDDQSVPAISIRNKSTDPRLSSRFSGPRSIVTLTNPAPDTFIQADVSITYNQGCGAQPSGSVSADLCNGIDNLTGNNNADTFRINELGENPYERKVVVIRDWRDKPLGHVIDGVVNPNTVVNPVPENIQATEGNIIHTVRDMNDCKSSSIEDCAIKTSGGFWMAINASTGHVLWTTAHPAGGMIHGALTLSGNILYGGAMGGENLFVDEAQFPNSPLKSAVPKGGGLRYAFDKHTGKILYRFHDELVANDIEVDEYTVANPLVLKNKIIWGSGPGHYLPVDTTQSGNKLHAFKLVNQPDDDGDDHGDSDGDDVIGY